MTEDPLVRTQDNNTGGKYRVGRTGPEESANKSSKWSREEMEESELEEEAKTAGGGGVGHNYADGKGRGIGGKRHGRWTRGRSGRRGRHS